MPAPGDGTLQAPSRRRRQEDAHTRASVLSSLRDDPARDTFGNSTGRRLGQFGRVPAIEANAVSPSKRLADRFETKRGHPSGSWRRAPCENQGWVIIKYAQRFDRCHERDVARSRGFGGIRSPVLLTIRAFERANHAELRQAFTLHPAMTPERRRDGVRPRVPVRQAVARHVCAG